MERVSKKLTPLSLSLLKNYMYVACPVIGTNTVETMMKKKYLKRLLLYLLDVVSKPRCFETNSTRTGMKMKLKNTRLIGSIRG